VAQTYHSNVTRRCFPTPPHHLELHLTGLHPQIPQLLGQYPRRASVE
jgi:hypothetical protein